MIRSFMPNFIHSLDASNVHLLLYKLIKSDQIPVYTNKTKQQKIVTPDNNKIKGCRP